MARGRVRGSLRRGYRDADPFSTGDNQPGAVRVAGFPRGRTISMSACSLRKFSHGP
jgi:hypothetical protein